MLRPDPKPEPHKKSKRTRIKFRSDKRAVQEKEYKVLRDQFLEDNPTCQACHFKQADQVHHKAGRIGKLLTDVDYFMACCGTCHQFIEMNPSAALKMGWIVKRTNK
jgi:5-methylcytosine-specific restriction endonuclease McrA